MVIVPKPVQIIHVPDTVSFLSGPLHLVTRRPKTATYGCFRSIASYLAGKMLYKNLKMGYWLSSRTATTKVLCEKERFFKEA
jgi:hypothetical protein